MRKTISIVALVAAVLCCGCVEAPGSILGSGDIDGKYVLVWDKGVTATFSSDNTILILDNGVGTTGTYEIVSTTHGVHTVHTTAPTGSVWVVTVDGDIMTDPDGDIWVKNPEKNIGHQEVKGKTYYSTWLDGYISFDDNTFTWHSDPSNPFGKYQGTYTHTSNTEIQLNFPNGRHKNIIVYEHQLKFDKYDTWTSR